MSAIPARPKCWSTSSGCGAEQDSGARSSISGASAAAPHPPAWKSALLVLAALLVLIGGTIGGVLLFTARGGPAATPAQSGRPSLAVMNFENRTGDERYDRYGVGATELLTVNLAARAQTSIWSARSGCSTCFKA